MKRLFKIAKEDSLILRDINSSTIFDREIRVLVWNVYKKNSTIKWQNEFKKIASIYHPNLVLFQEYALQAQSGVPNSFSHFGYLFFPNFSYKKRLFGLMSASVGRIVDYKFYFSKHKEPILRTPKMILLTKYLLKNMQTLLVVNVHFINFVRVDKFISQLEQLEELCKVYNQPIIVAGDFNTWNRKRVKLLLEMAEKLGLKKVEFAKSRLKKSLLQYPLDYIFYRGLELKESKVLDFCKVSDHTPLYASFKV